MKYYPYKNLYLKTPITTKRAEELNLRPVVTLNYDSLETKESKITYYKYRFPVVYWERKDGFNMPTLFCEITIDSYDWRIIVDVKNVSGQTYADFYCSDLKDPKQKSIRPMLSKVVKIINKELNKLDVYVKKNKERKKRDGSTVGKSITSTADIRKHTKNSISPESNKTIDRSDTRKKEYKRSTYDTSKRRKVFE